MGAQRERFAAWLQSRGRPPEPQLETLLLRAADAYDTVKEGGELLLEHLRVIVDAASSSRALLWMNAVDLLGILAEQWPLAVQAVLEMSRDRKAHVRFNAICCLRTGTPDAVANAILKAALSDKSSRVRWKAGDHTERLGKRNVIPGFSAHL